MRQRFGPTCNANIKRLIMRAIEPLAFGGDQFRICFIAQIYNLVVQCASKNPGLGVRRAASCKNRSIEKHSARAESLIARKQTTKAVELCRIRSLKAGRSR